MANASKTGKSSRSTIINAVNKAHHKISEVLVSNDLAGAMKQRVKKTSSAAGSWMAANTSLSQKDLSNIKRSFAPIKHVSIAFILFLLLAVSLNSCKKDEFVIGGTDVNLSNVSGLADDTPGLEVNFPDTERPEAKNASLTILFPENTSLIIPPEDLLKKVVVPNTTQSNASSAALNFSQVAVVGTNSLKVMFLDVGRGDSTFVISPNGGTMMVDGGNNEAGSKIISVFRANSPDKTILDVMVGTNPQDENIGGLDSIAFNVAQIVEIYDTGEGREGQTYAGFKELGSAKGFFMSINKDTPVKLDTDMEIMLNIPYKDGFFNSTNDNSIVVKMTYKHVSFLIMSRCGAQCEKALEGYDLRADVLRVANFGHNISTSDALLNAVSPKIAIISSGDYSKSNPQPSPAVIERLTQRDIRIYRTDKNGTITINTDGSALDVQTER